MEESPNYSIDNPFCSRVYHERIVRTFSDRVAPCCKMEGKIISSGSFESLVDDVKAGVKREECSICWRAEENGVTSHRQRGNRIWNNVKAQHMEIYYESLCDIACIYCNPLYSSKWAAEAKKNKEAIPKYYLNPYFKSEKVQPKHNQYILKEIERMAEWSHRGWRSSITLLGGEPLIHSVNDTSLLETVLSEFYKRASSEAEFGISIQTNGNSNSDVLKRSIDTLKYFKDRYRGLFVHIGLSGESTNKNFEYVRYGAEWERFRNNMEAWGKTGFKITMQTAMNAVAICDLENLLVYANTFSKEISPLEVRISPVDYPEELSLGILDDSFQVYFDDALSFLKNNKTYLLTKDETYQDIKDLREMIGKKNSSSLLSKTKDMVRYYKEVRGLDLKDVNPHLNQYLIEN